MNELRNGLSLDEKLEILSDAAKYDVACTSSGVDRRGKEGYLGNSCAAGVCHAFAADGRCISLLKILMTNHCSYDCKYCKNRRSNDIPRATFTPEEICTLTMEFYKRNYIEGLFLSSGVLGTADYTMEKMCEALRMLREVYKFNGYIHLKVIPGASPELLYSAGLLADRISINLELPTSDSLSLLAPNKSMTSILRPMNRISETIVQNRLALGKSANMERAGINRHLVNSIFGPSARPALTSDRRSTSSAANGGKALIKTDAAQMAGAVSPVYNRNRIGDSILDGTGLQGNINEYIMQDSNRVETGSNNSIIGSLMSDSGTALCTPADKRDMKRPFATGGQSTQMIIGATGETDFDLIRTTQCLYKSFDLKRVFFSAYIPLNSDSVLPSLDSPVPLLREHRLYQADWLLRYYGFQAEELLSDEQPNFDSRIDPKCDWAIRHIDQFPVEVNKASYEMLLRVPGIGPTGVKKIMSARRYGNVTFEMLKQMHITLKRAQYFITCNGRMLYRIPFEQQFIRNNLIALDRTETMQFNGSEVNFRQLNLFDDFGLTTEIARCANV